MSDNADIMGCQLLAAQYLRNLRRNSVRFITIDLHSYLLTDNNAEYLLWATTGDAMTTERIDTTDPQFHEFLVNLASLGLGEVKNFRGVWFFFAK